MTVDPSQQLGGRGAREVPPPPAHHVRQCLERARQYERAGQLGDAAAAYEDAVALADSSLHTALRCDALRRLAILQHRRQLSDAAEALSRRACATALSVNDDMLLAETLNTRASIDLDRGLVKQAHCLYQEALRIGAHDPSLRGRIQQNLGIIATIRGETSLALARYEDALAAYRECGDKNGCAMVAHNLGMLSADRALWDDAEQYFQQSVAFAETSGDQQLKAQSLLSASEVHLARRDFDRAGQNAERALSILMTLGAQRYTTDAHRILGIVSRETGRPTISEARLRRAIEAAVNASAVVSEAEAWRELALLYQQNGRRAEACASLGRARMLFEDVGARADLADIEKRLGELQVGYQRSPRAD